MEKTPDNSQQCHIREKTEKIFAFFVNGLPFAVYAVM
jgi:hypothetical protein